MAGYTGAVVFVSGVHYPATDDGADLTRPLRVVETGGYRDAKKGEPLHNEVNHQREAALEVGGEN